MKMHSTVGGVILRSTNLVPPPSSFRRSQRTGLPRHERLRMCEEAASPSPRSSRDPSRKRDGPFCRSRRPRSGTSGRFSYFQAPIICGESPAQGPAGSSAFDDLRPGLGVHAKSEAAGGSIRGYMGSRRVTKFTTAAQFLPHRPRPSIGSAPACGVIVKDSSALVIPSLPFAQSAFSLPRVMCSSRKGKMVEENAGWGGLNRAALNTSGCGIPCHTRFGAPSRDHVSQQADSLRCLLGHMGYASSSQSGWKSSRCDAGKHRSACRSDSDQRTAWPTTRNRSFQGLQMITQRHNPTARAEKLVGVEERATRCAACSSDPETSENHIVHVAQDAHPRRNARSGRKRARIAPSLRADFNRGRRVLLPLSTRYKHPLAALGEWRLRMSAGHTTSALHPRPPETANKPEPPAKHLRVRRISARSIIQLGSLLASCSLSPKAIVLFAAHRTLREMAAFQPRSTAHKAAQRPCSRT